MLVTITFSYSVLRATTEENHPLCLSATKVKKIEIIVSKYSTCFKNV